jgi:hypothetical protein
MPRAYPHTDYYNSFQISPAIFIFFSKIELISQKYFERFRINIAQNIAPAPKCVYYATKAQCHQGTQKINH